MGLGQRLRHRAKYLIAEACFRDIILYNNTAFDISDLLYTCMT